MPLAVSVRCKWENETDSASVYITVTGRNRHGWSHLKETCGRTTFSLSLNAGGKNIFLCSPCLLAIDIKALFCLLLFVLFWFVFFVCLFVGVFVCLFICLFVGVFVSLFAWKIFNQGNLANSHEETTASLSCINTNIRIWVLFVQKTRCPQIYIKLTLFKDNDSRKRTLSYYS